MSHKKLHWPQKSLLGKNLQFSFYPNETWSKWLPPELDILTKFHEDRIKIVDFLLIVTFLASCKFLRSPSMYIALEYTPYIQHNPVANIEERATIHLSTFAISDHPAL